MNRKKSIILLSLVVITLLFTVTMTGCGGGGTSSVPQSSSSDNGGGGGGGPNPTPTPTPVPITALRFDIQSGVLVPGMTQQFRVIGTTTAAAATGRGEVDITAQCSLSTSDNTIATINQQGLATAVKAGIVTLTATEPSSGLSAQATLDVKSAIGTGLTFDLANPNVVAGNAVQLTVTGSLSDGTTLDFTESVDWTSSNTAIATVSNAAGTKGLVTAVAPGVATIAVSFDNGVAGARKMVTASTTVTSDAKIPAPNPPGVTTPADYIQDNAKAIELGKALFWEMQVGSDGIQACASCHFHAGSDDREQNQINPGANGVFDVVAGPNGVLVAGDFPFHQRVAPVDDKNSAVLRDSDDVKGSHGVALKQFAGVNPNPNNFVDLSTPLADPVFNIGGVNVRAVTGANTPQAVGATHKFNNFWNGRANFYFNGNNPFGPTDLNSGIYLEGPGATLDKVRVMVGESSLASQSVGPPLNEVEMSWKGRAWPHIGKKLLQPLRVPLAQQQVDPTDSVIGGLANPGTGLNTNYVAMIQAAFKPEYWNSTDTVDIQTSLGTETFTQMEANFSFYWGLAVQAYEQTLVPNQSPFDQFLAGNDAALTADEKAGFSIFKGGGHCDRCHTGDMLSNATIAEVQASGIIIEKNNALLDNGFSNIGVTLTANDVGRGGTDAFGFPLSWTRLALTKATLPALLQPFVPDLPAGAPVDANVDGAFAAPILRNVELTGPYFHNGGAGTLMQLVDFYTRLGNFPNQNAADLDPDILTIRGGLKGSEVKKSQLIAFLLALTDPRVKIESAPFDHPQLFYPDDALEGAPLTELPAVGAAGTAPLQPFLNLDPFSH